MVDTRPKSKVEDYLGVIYILERDGEPVIGARLAKWMRVSAPTVTATVKQMVEGGWVTVDERKEIHLTKAGRDAAQSLLRRHMLSELLLARLLGVPWSRVHQEADEMEHIISRETVESLLERFNDATTCPHGNPLPGHEEQVEDWVPLTSVQAGQMVIIRRVHESAEEKVDMMAFLEKHKLMPGTSATVKDVIPFNQTITLQVGEQEVALGFTVAEKIYVEIT